MADKILCAIVIIMCHLIGDYALQTDFIAKSKGENWYHMFVHCVLYCVPFAIMFGINFRLAVIFATHIIIDSLKARYSRVTYAHDQICHYLVAGLMYLI